jgi:hypothetical protein
MELELDDAGEAEGRDLGDVVDVDQSQRWSDLEGVLLDNR